MTDDDWAPLPPGELCLQPGEQADVPRRAVAPPVPAPVATAAPPPPPRLSPEEERAAELALRALQAKLAQAGPAHTFVAEFHHREQKVARRQRAAHQPELASTVVAVPAPAAGPAPEPAPESATASATEPQRVDAGPELDPRELEPWFRELPEAERARLRAAWFAGRHRHDDQWRVLRRRLVRAFAYGGGLFLAMGLLQSLLLGGFGLVLPLALGGAVAAAVAEACGGGRFVYAGCGGLAFAIVLGPAVILQPLSLATILIASFGMGALGMDGEMRRSGGFGDRDPSVTAPPPAPRS